VTRDLLNRYFIVLATLHHDAGRIFARVVHFRSVSFIAWIVMYKSRILFIDDAVLEGRVQSSLRSTFATGLARPRFQPHLPALLSSSPCDAMLLRPGVVDIPNTGHCQVRRGLLDRGRRGPGPQALRAGQHRTRLPVRNPPFGSGRAEDEGMSDYRGPGLCRDCGGHSDDRRQGNLCGACWQVRLDVRRRRWEEGPVALYRLYDEDGNLLYIGITPEVVERWKDRRRRMPWWPEVARDDITWLDGGRVAAMRAEGQAIMAERPWYNRSPMDDDGRPDNGVLPEGCPPQPGFAWHPKRSEYWPDWFRWRALFRELQLNRQERAARESAVE